MTGVLNSSRMSTLDYQRTQLQYGRDTTGEVSLFNFFNAVYGWMAVGLGVTGIVALLGSWSPQVLALLSASPFVTVALALGAFALAWVAQTVALRVSAAAGLALFFAYACVMGLMLSGIFVLYPVSTIGAAFLVTGGTFAATSVFGMVTQRDLSGIGRVLVMCAFGLFFASIVNVFVASDAFSWFITYAVLAVFIGITAYETQLLKNLALEHGHDSTMTGRIAVVGSLILYIAFINIFLSVLRIMGDRD